MKLPVEKKAEHLAQCPTRVYCKQCRRDFQKSQTSSKAFAMQVLEVSSVSEATHLDLIEERASFDLPGTDKMRSLIQASTMRIRRLSPLRQTSDSSQLIC
jgi:hypothetical protein